MNEDSETGSCAAKKKLVQQQKSIKLYGHRINKTDVISNVQMNFRTIEVSIVLSLTVDGRPAHYVEDEGFKYLVRPLLKRMPDSKALNAEYAWKLVENAYDKLKSKIITETRNQMVSLKIDAATYHGRSFLGN